MDEVCLGSGGMGWEGVGMLARGREGTELNVVEVGSSWTSLPGHAARRSFLEGS